MGKCPHCGGDIEIRNPTGTCDHLYYPDNCDVCSGESKKKNKIELAHSLLANLLEQNEIFISSEVGAEIENIMEVLS